MLNNENKQYHINVSRGEIGRYCIVPGDPGRCEKIASFLENPKQISYNREYCVWNGTLMGETVTVCSTGIGGPSTAIAIEELAACGADTFIRVGTCGGMQLDVRSGDAVIATGAVRQDGTSREYAPAEFPAVSHPDVLFALIGGAKTLGAPYHAGIVQSKDSFYGQHSPRTMPTSQELLAKWDAWKALGVLASEMEASTLFVVGAARKLRAGAVFLSVWNQERYDAGLDGDSDECHDTSLPIKIAVEALKSLIKTDKNLK